MLTTLPVSLLAQRLLRYLLVFYLLPTGSKLLFYVQKKLENIEFYNCADACFMQPCRIKEFRVINSTTPACTVKILAINIFNLRLDVIIDLMRCFPCLEKLYIQVNIYSLDLV